MNLSTTAIELAALTLGTVVLSVFGSPEAADHPRLMLLGVIAASVGISVIVISGLKRSRR
jgi:hypothetical protein